MTLLEKYQNMLDHDSALDLKEKVELSYRIYVLKFQKILVNDLDKDMNLDSCITHLECCKKLKSEMFPDADAEMTEYLRRCFFKYRSIQRPSEYKMNIKKTLDALLKKWFDERQKIENI